MKGDKVKNSMIERLEKNKVLYVYFPLILYWLMLFIGTSLPSSAVPGMGVSDKFKHFAAYAILSFMLVLTYRVQTRLPLLRRNAPLFSIITTMAYGVLDELHQMLIPGRSCELGDYIADTIGAVIGVSCAVYILKLWSNRNSGAEA